ncbi:hypothetical protein CK203_030771 [Vitis vinifera]|uniref:Retrovirus-related Pol polyprotein from transposon TNT 1-94-like beta-barrel domain-containing protein n=1 Tax=Vitis vinifera TaxID=29760 RepID=A0A438ICU2_VITVI|nr:hypothetical protein CK203_030771 [Vitis vinifera]
MHGRSKHIDVRFHFLRDLTKEEVVKLVHCGTNDQVVDILTKSLKLEVFLKLREKLGNFLRSKKYWSIVENEIPLIAEGSMPTQAQRKEVEEARLKDMKIKNYMFQSIDKTIMKTILDNNTSKSIWDSIRQKYQGSTRVKQAQLQALRKEFEILQMKEGEKVDEYFAKGLTIANKMKAHEERMGQNVIVEKILRSMTPRLDYVVYSIEESNNVDMMTTDELQSSLLVHEQRMNCHSGNARDEQALRFRMEKGHFQYECPSWEKSVNYAEFNEEEEILFMSYVEVNNSKREDVWFLDSCCSNHMWGNRQWFSNIDEAFRHLVKLNNNTRMGVMGKGNIRLKINGSTQVVTDVYYVLALKNNLLSIGQLQERGLAIIIQNGECKLYHPRRGLIM